MSKFVIMFGHRSMNRLLLMLTLSLKEIKYKSHFNADEATLLLHFLFLYESFHKVFFMNFYILYLNSYIVILSLCVTLEQQKCTKLAYISFRNISFKH